MTLRMNGIRALGVCIACLSVLAAETGAPPVGSPPGGTIEGTVTLGGTSTPSPTTVMNSTDPEVCGREHSLRDLVVSRENRGVRYTIVALTGVPEPRIPDTPPERVLIDNRDCQFLPHATVATLGDTVVARNSDAVLHNTHYYGPLRSNIALPVEGMTAARVTIRTGLVSVLCDVHGWMKAYIRIDPHSFHDVTGSDGRFRIEDVPPGNYTLELWHETLGTRRIEVAVEADRDTTVDVEYPAPSD